MLCDGNPNVTALVHALVNVFTPRIDATTTKNVTVLEEQAKVACRAAIRRQWPDRTPMKEVLAGTELVGSLRLTREDYIKTFDEGCPMHLTQLLMTAEWRVLDTNNNTDVQRDPKGWRHAVETMRLMHRKNWLPPCLSPAPPTDDLYTWRLTDVASYVEALIAAPLVAYAMRVLKQSTPVVLNDMTPPPWLLGQDEVAGQFKPFSDQEDWLHCVVSEPTDQLDQLIARLAEEWVQAFLGYTTELRKQKAAELTVQVCIQLNQYLEHLHSVLRTPLTVLDVRRDKINQAIEQAQKSFVIAETRRRQPVPPINTDFSYRFCCLAAERSKRRQLSSVSLDQVVRDVYQDLYQVSRIARARLDSQVVAEDRPEDQVYERFQGMIVAARGIELELTSALVSEASNSHRIQEMWLRDLYNRRMHILGDVRPSITQVAQWQEMSKLIPGFVPLAMGDMERTPVMKWLDAVAHHVVEKAGPLIASSQLFHSCPNSIISTDAMSL